VQGFKTIFAKKLVIVLQKLCHNILIINALSPNQQLLNNSSGGFGKFEITTKRLFRTSMLD